MSRHRSRAFVLSLGAALWTGAAAIAPSPAVAAGPTDLPGVHALESRVLAGLLKLALKEDARRQVWYLATRLLVADPKNDEAEAALKKWDTKDLELANPPSKGFKEKRDAGLRQVGDAYAQLVRDQQAKGAKPVDTFGLVERALAYGTKAADAAAALEGAGQVWCGTYGTQAKDDVKAAFGTLGDVLTWTPEYEDAYLRAKIPWPDARVFGLRDWRIVTAPTLAAAGKAATSVAAVEAHFVKSLGSIAKEANVKEDDPNWDLIVVPDVKTYDQLAEPLFHNDDPTRTSRLAASSGWLDGWRKRTLVSEKHRDVDWVAPEALLSGWLARILARRHLGTGGSGKIGRGAWILEGIGGVYEGFRAKGPEGGDLDFARCWRLAAAKALKDRGALIAWPKFLELDDLTAQDEAKEDVKLSFDGAPREAKKVEVVGAQATAYLAGLWTHEGDKGLKKLSALLIETFKRGRLPDVDKTCGWRPGTAADAAVKALDLAPAK